MLNESDIVREQLEAARKDLLNLGLRNKLISYKPLRARGLEIVDELPEEIFRILVNDGRTVSFIPAADDEETAGGGQPEGKESPRAEGRHTDARLQTSLSPTNLQTRLLSTYRLANTFIQEQGVNTLFLALGMVNWYESDSSQDARKAPLILVPVHLERTDVNDRFQLAYSGEEIGGNLSFKEKIWDEFHLTLPDLPDPDDLEFSQFFNAVENEIQVEPRWSVDRGSVVLAFFSFSKFLMYRDLDLDTWPEEQNSADHPVLGALLDKGFREPPSEFDDDTSPDPVLTSKDIYHVVDADGSTNPLDVSSDTKVDRVLSSNDFAYWGGNGPKLPNNFTTRAAIDIRAHRGHKCRFPDALVRDFVDWIRGIGDRGYLDEPLDWRRTP